MKNFFVLLLALIVLVCSARADSIKYIFSLDKKCNVEGIKEGLDAALSTDDSEFLSALNMYIATTSADKIEEVKQRSVTLTNSGLSFNDCVLFYEEDQIVSINQASAAILGSSLPFPQDNHFYVGVEVNACIGESRP